MKNIFLSILLLITVSVCNAQYNPSNFTVSNKSYGVAQAVPTDARSFFYDGSLFVMRPYQSTTEVLSYLNLAKYRVGNFPIYVNVGGTLNSGVFTGGSIVEYWFKDGMAEGNLVAKLVPETDPKRVTGVAITGTTTKTVTLTLADASTVTGTFTDISGGGATDTSSLSNRINSKLDSVTANKHDTLTAYKNGSASYIIVQQDTGYSISSNTFTDRETEKLREIAFNYMLSYTTASTLTFPYLTNISNTSEVYQGTVNTSSTNYGLSDRKLVENSEGYVQLKFTATDGIGGVLGFDLTNINTDQTNIEAGIYIADAAGHLGYVVNGTFTQTTTVIPVGNYVRLARVGSVFKVQQSSTGFNWADIITLSFVSSAELYTRIYIIGTGKLYEPKAYNTSLAGTPSTLWTGKTSSYFGDSFVFGDQASSTAKRWTSLLSTMMGATEANFGIDGEVLEAGSVCGVRTVFNQTTIVSYNSSTSQYLFIALGTNDIGLNNGTFSPSGYQTKLGTVIDYAIATKGWPASKIVIVSPYYWYNYPAYVGVTNVSCGTSVAADVTRHEQYVAAGLTVAQTKHTVYADPYTFIKHYSTPNVVVSTDGLHPNDPGYQLIAAYMSNLNYTPQ